MSILARIKRVTTGRLELFLSRAEDPEVVFPQLISEMEEQVRTATAAEAKAMTVAKQAEKSLAAVQEKLAKMRDGARMALGGGNEGMAREAVEAQIALEADQVRREAALQAANGSLDEARAARMETQKQLQLVKEKKDEILSRARVVQIQERVENGPVVPSASTGSILDAVASLEAHVEEREANVAVNRELSGSVSGASSTLERRIDDMNRQSEIDRRMEELKANMTRAE